MKTTHLFFIVFSVIILSSTLSQEVDASCAIPVDYQAASEESELIFVGTVTNIEKPKGPQLVTFDVHNVMKGPIKEDEYILADHGNVKYDDSYTLSSVSVDYKVGITYLVFVINGETNNCTTMPVDQMTQGFSISETNNYNIYSIVAFSVGVVAIAGFVLWKKRKPAS